MRGRITRCSLLAAAALATAGSSEPTIDCPQDSSKVVVKAVRFSDSPPAYSFRVTNNGTRSVGIVVLGEDAERRLRIAPETVPTSIGSPTGWEGIHVFGQDPRRQKVHSPTLITYLWTAKKPEARIQPGQSLSGFSVQLPPGSENTKSADGSGAGFDISNLPFLVHPYGARCPVIGTVELD